MKKRPHKSDQRTGRESESDEYWEDQEGPGGGARVQAEKGECPLGQHHCIMLKTEQRNRLGEGQLSPAWASRLIFCF